jgi:hypothetical protein
VPVSGRGVSSAYLALPDLRHARHVLPGDVPLAGALAHMATPSAGGDVVKRGDLLLYAATARWYEQLIARVTQGPFVHVSIIYDEQHCLAADANGISMDSLPAEDSQHVVIPIDPTLQIDAGLEWASLQVGRRYGWTDIAYQAVKFLAPNNPWQLCYQGRWDCADYATRYLDRIGYKLPEMYSDPYTMTPNDIGRLFGLLPPRKAAK